MDPFDDEARCCLVDNVCGFSLKRGVVYVGLASFVISSLALLSALICLSWMAAEDAYYNKRPVQAVDMLMALYCTSTSIYQLVLSIMLLWQSVWTKGSIFISTTWYVSHVSILMFYLLLFCGRVVVSLSETYYAGAFFTVLGATLYIGVFIYFIMIVYSYQRMLDAGS